MGSALLFHSFNNSRSIEIFVECTLKMSFRSGEATHLTGRGRHRESLKARLHAHLALLLQGFSFQSESLSIRVRFASHLDDDERTEGKLNANWPECNSDRKTLAIKAPTESQLDANWKQTEYVHASLGTPNGSQLDCINADVFSRSPFRAHLDIVELSVEIHEVFL